MLISAISLFWLLNLYTYLLTFSQHHLARAAGRFSGAASEQEEVDHPARVSKLPQKSSGIFTTKSVPESFLASLPCWGVPISSLWP